MIKDKLAPETTVGDPAVEPARLPVDLRVLREDEAADLLAVHTQTLRRWRRAGTGPAHIRLGVRLFGYRVADLRAWQEAQAAG